MLHTINSITTAKEKDAIYQHLVSLPDEAKYTRFFIKPTDEYIKRYVDNISANNDVCFGMYDNQTLVAFAHIGSIHTNPELGISVSKDYQGKGIAKSIMKRVIVWCKANNVNQLSMECLKENHSMKKLARATGFSVVIDEYSAIAAAIESSFTDKLNAIAQNLVFENISLVDNRIRENYKAIQEYYSQIGKLISENTQFPQIHQK